MSLDPTRVVVTTTPSLEGRRVREYKGIVTGEAIVGANLFRDLFAGITDLVGGRSGAYEKVLQHARETALSEMQTQAAERGADAVLGVDLDYEVLGQANGMLMVTASGTAVVTVSA
jgi:uncharacterized protein YbjQ (UPF0145 family)